MINVSHWTFVLCYEPIIAGLAIVCSNKLKKRMILLDHLDALTPDCIVHSGKKFQLCVKDKFTWR